MENSIIINQQLKRSRAPSSCRFKAMHLYSRILILILVINRELVLAEDTIVTINGVVGQSVGLPCVLESRYTSTSAVKLISDSEDGSQLSRPLSIDEVYGNEVSLILWYRHRSSGVPIYAVDSRQQNLDQAIHQNYVDQESIKFSAHQKLFVNRTVNEIFQNVKGRFVFNLAENPPKLWIRKLEQIDAGQYRCRADYRGDRTQNSIIHLHVAVPPRSLFVLNSLNKELDTGRRIGPYEEQDYVSLTCVSIGGIPLPSLHWYIKDNLTDSSYIVNALDGRVENELIIGRLDRKNFDQKYECRAVLNETVLLSTYVVIDLNLKPLTINFTQVDKKLTSGLKATFECSSSGSKPPAELAFFKDGKPIRNNNGHLSESKDNHSYAKLVTILNNSDDGKTLTCRAFNPKLTKQNDYLEQNLLLDVKYLPQLTINLGTAIKRENIREGTDVYLECNVKSNPPVQEIQWTFEKEPIVFDQSQGSKILAINHTLIMQQVKKERRGNYACIARNPLGESTSQPFFLKIKYSPICKNPEPQVLMLDKNELVQLNCEFNADPTELQFSWTLNFNENSLEEFNSLPAIGEQARNQSEIVNKLNSFYTKQISLNEFVSNHSQSMLNYVINERNTYGEIHCSASNYLGSSVQPCRFLIIPHGPPSCVPSNCDVKNTINEIILNCEHCDQLPPNPTGSIRKTGRTRNNLDAIHMLTGSLSNDIAYNLKVYMPINTGDLIKPSKSSSTEWNDQNENSDNSIMNNARKQEDTGLIHVNDELKTTDPMKFQGQNGQSSSSSFNPNTALLVKNLTNSDRPQFRISDLKPATVYLLFLTAFNGKGISEVRSFSISTLGSPERQLAMDTTDQVTFNPLLIALISFVSIVVIFSTLILVIIRMKSNTRQRQTNLPNSNEPPGPNLSSSSLNCPNKVLNNNKLKITDTSKDKNKKSKGKSKGKSITLQSVTKINEFQYKDGLELRETNYGLPKTQKKNGIYHEYDAFTQDGNLYTSNNNHLTNIATPSPAPSSNTTSMNNSMLNTQPIYNSSSTGGSSLQLNSSYNYPPTANAVFHSGYHHNKFGTLNGPLNGQINGQLNGSPNFLNQSLNNNLGPLGSLTSTVNSANANLNSLQSLGSTTALVTSSTAALNYPSYSATKRVMFVGDTPQSNQLHNNSSGLIADSSLAQQLLPAHPTGGAYSIAQPVYNSDLNVTDVFYGTVNNSTLAAPSLQAPMKMPRLNYLSNSRINLTNSLNTLANQSTNQQPSNSVYFPVVSYRLSKEQINHSNSTNGNHATPV